MDATFFFMFEVLVHIKVNLESYHTFVRAVYTNS